jgi:UDP-MurNAc hydroxylase
VQEYFAQHQVKNPTVKVMVSGDSWSTDEGFCIADSDFFSNRPQRLQDYLEANREKLEKFYEKESRSKVTLQDMQKYFEKFFRAIPFLVRRLYRNQPITYVLSADDKKSIYLVDIYNKRVEQLDRFDDETNPIQIHTSTLIMRQCLKMDLFSHLAISKRVRYRSRKRDKHHIERLNLLFNFYEYDMLPVRRVFQGRFFQTWTLRWREVLLYFHLLWNKLIYGNLRLRTFLPPRPRADALALTNEAIAQANARRAETQAAEPESVVSRSV